jgi:hypothetical protein
MVVHGLSCGSFENCGFTIMAGIDGVDETKGSL